MKGFDFRKAYKFYDYCTIIFKKIRENFGIEGDAYLKSIGPEYLLVYQKFFKEILIIIRVALLWETYYPCLN